MDQEKFLELEPLELNKYEDVDLDHLVMYAIGQLEKINAELSFENVVMASFKLFPQKFSLLGFPEYPDANRVAKCLWRSTSKAKQWLGGKIRQGFFITDRSRSYLKEAEDILRGQFQKEKKAPSQTRRIELLLKEVTLSPAYLKHAEKKGHLISEGDICYLLQGTLDSDREMLKKNLFLLRNHASELKRGDLLEFFDWIEERFQEFFDSGKK